jgi:hypothetical protein
MLIVRDRPCDVPTLRQGDLKARAFFSAKHDEKYKSAILNSSELTCDPVMNCGELKLNVFYYVRRKQTDPWFTIRQMRPDGIERVRTSVENEYRLIAERDGRIVGIGVLALKNAELLGYVVPRGPMACIKMRTTLRCGGTDCS